MILFLQTTREAREGRMDDASDNDSDTGVRMDDASDNDADLAVSQTGCWAQYPAPAPRMSSGSSLSAP